MSPGFEKMVHKKMCEILTSFLFLLHLYSNEDGFYLVILVIVNVCVLGTEPGPHDLKHVLNHYALSLVPE